MLGEYEELDEDMLLALRLAMVYFVSRDVEKTATTWEMQVMAEMIYDD